MHHNLDLFNVTYDKINEHNQRQHQDSLDV